MEKVTTTATAPKANITTGTDCPAIPTGVYSVRIAEARDRMPHLGNCSIVLTLEIVQGEYAGMTICQHIADNAFAAQHIKDIMDACGKQCPKQITSAMLQGLTGKVQLRTDHAGVYWITPRCRIAR